MSNVIVWLLVTIMYAPLILSLYKATWESIDYTHAYFILPISIFIAWSKRKDLRAAYKTNANKFAAIGLYILIGGLVLFMFSWRQGYLSLSTFSLIPVLFGVISYLYGAAVVRMLTFPIFYLLMMVPPPMGILDSVTLPMRYGISVVAEWILKVCHYPIHREGLLLYISNHEIFMGLPCSGFRSLITMFSLTLAYVYFAKGGAGKKMILLAASVPFALLGNCVRVISMCLITYYYGEKYAEGLYHGASGIIIFVVMILCLLGLENLLDRRHS